VQSDRRGSPGRGRSDGVAGGGITISVVREYRGFERRYGELGALVTCFQFLYYLLESVMVVLILGLWQRAGGIWTGITNVPWGGLGLTLTWGAAHFLSHSAGALTVVVTAFVFGFAFLGVRTSALPAVGLVWAMFFL